MSSAAVPKSRIRRTHAIGIVLALGVVAALAGCAGPAGQTGDSAALNRQGNQDADAGRYADAEDKLTRALSIRQSSSPPNTGDVAQSLYNLGRLYRIEGRYGAAEPLLRQALALREQTLGTDNPGLVSTLNEFGYLSLLRGRHADAERLYRRSLSSLETSPDRADPRLAETLANLGYLYLVLDRNAEAAATFERALRLREAASIPDRVATARTLNNLGFIYMRLGRYAEASPLMQRALAMRRETLGPAHPDVAETLADLGELDRVQGRFRDAEPLLREAVAIRQNAQGPDHPDVATKGFAVLSTLYESEGRPDAALEASTHAVETLQRHLLASAGLRSAPTPAEIGQYRGTFLRNIALLAGAAGPAGKVERAFLVAQSVESSAAAQAVAAMAVRFAAGTNGLAAAIRELQQQGDRWQQLDAALLAAAARPTAERNAVEEATLRRQYDEAGRRLSALEVQVSTEFPPYAALASAAPLSVSAVQALLEPDEAMLVYLVGDDVTWLWAVRRDTAAMFRVPLGAAALAAVVSELRASLDPARNPSLRPFPARRSYALYQQLVGRAAAILAGARQILIVPDGALQSLPMGVLVTQAPSRDPVSPADHRDVAWFAKDHPLTVLPSVRSIQALRSFTAASRAPLAFAGVGNPVLEGAAPPQGRGLAQALARPVGVAETQLFRGTAVDVSAVRQLPPLPETADELRFIGKTLGASESDLYLADRANEPALRRARLDTYRIVEFATHGLMSGDLGLGEPALVLTPPAVATVDDDGLLTASKIATMRFNADWVVLSACNTAASDGTPDGGGFSGLAKAFFFAGARSLLVSHWSVSSSATVALTTGAFAELGHDPSIGRAEALRRAIIAMMSPAAPAEFSHPMAWAPFVLAGDGRPGR